MYFQGFLMQICPQALHSGYFQEQLFSQNAINGCLLSLETKDKIKARNNK